LVFEQQDDQDQQIQILEKTENDQKTQILPPTVQIVVWGFLVEPANIHILSCNYQWSIYPHCHKEFEKTPVIQLYFAALVAGNIDSISFCMYLDFHNNTTEH
jgi:hypothetical protein